MQCQPVNGWSAAEFLQYLVLASWELYQPSQQLFRLPWGPVLESVVWIRGAYILMCLWFVLAEKMGVRAPLVRTALLRQARPGPWGEEALPLAFAPPRQR